MTSPNGKPQIKRLQLADLFIDKRYQRPLHEARVARYAIDFEPIMCGALEVSTRANGKNAVLDGQHRLAVLNLLGETAWECRVHEGLSLKDEASLFVRLQTQRQSVPPIHRHKALLIEGDPIATNVENLVNDAGFRITVNKVHGALTCVQGLYEAHETHGAEALRGALHLIDEVWGKSDSYARKAPMVVGVTMFLARAGKMPPEKRPDIESLKERLSGLTSAQVVRDSQSQGTTHTSHPVRVAMQLQAIYNRRRTTGQVRMSFRNSPRG